MTDFDPQQEELFEQLRKHDGDGADEMVFRVTRTPTPDRTFSSDAMESVLGAVRTFVGARLLRVMGERAKGEPGPSDLTISVTLNIDGKTIHVHDRMPWFAVDGEASREPR